MSVSALTWAFNRPMTDPTAKSVLVALADHADEHGRCWPSNHRIQDHTALGERAVRAALKRLAAMGAIVENAHSGRATDYVLQFQWAGQTPAPDAAPARRAPGIKCPPPRHQMPGTPARGAGTPARRAPEPSRTIIEPSVNQDTAPAEPSPANGATHDRKQTTRGTRLPADWQPDPQDRDFAEQLGLNADIIRDEFRDFWVGVPGSRGLKLDWPATFRNRCRDIAGKSGSHRPNGANGTREQNRPTGHVASALRVLARRGLL